MESWDAVLGEIRELKATIGDIPRAIASRDAEYRAILENLRADLGELMKIIRGNGKPGLSDDVVELRTMMHAIEHRVGQIEGARVRDGSQRLHAILQLVGWLIAMAGVAVAISRSSNSP